MSILNILATYFTYKQNIRENILNNLQNVQISSNQNPCAKHIEHTKTNSCSFEPKADKIYNLPAGNMYCGQKYQISFGKINSTTPSNKEKLKIREETFNKYFETIESDTEKNEAIEYILKNLADSNPQKISGKESLMKNFPWEELEYVMPPAVSSLTTAREIITEYSQKQKSDLCSYEKLNELCKNGVVLKYLTPPKTLISHWSENANNFPWEKLKDSKSFQKVLYSEVGIIKLLDNIKINDNLNEKQMLEMVSVLDDENFNEEIAKKVNNEEIEDAIELITSQEVMTKDTIAGLITSGQTKDDYEKSIMQLSKTLFRAMKTPNLYLNNIPIKYTTKVNDEYPKLNDEELMAYQEDVIEFFKDNYYNLISASSCMDIDTINQMMDRRFEAFKEKLEKCSSLTNENKKLLKNVLCGNKENGFKPCKAPYTDKEKELYIKKKEGAGKALTQEEIEKLKAQKQRKLTAREKIQLFEIVEIYQKTKLDTSILEEMAQNGEIDIQKLKNKITTEIFKNAGMTDEEIKNIPAERLKFNEEYSYLLLSNKKTSKVTSKVNKQIEQNAYETINSIYEMTNHDKLAKKEEIKMFGEAYLGSEYCKLYSDLLENFDKYTDEEKMQIAKNMHLGVYNMYFTNKYDEMDDIIKYSTTKDFIEFINDTSNEYGEINQKTKEIFKTNGINYKKWLTGANIEEKINVDNKKCTIKLWDRNPQEDLFIGNKTTCCTRIGEANSTATVAALLNTSFNIVELYDDKGDAVGMSRIFMANVNEKPAIIMDNFELNNTFIKRMSEEDMEKIRNGFFNYLHKFSKEITGDKATKIYMTGNAVDAKTSDLLDVTLTPDFIGETTQNHFYINSSACVNPKAMKDTEAKYYTEKN